MPKIVWVVKLSVIIETSLNNPAVERAVLTFNRVHTERLAVVIIVVQQLFKGSADQFFTDAELLIGKLPGLLLIELLRVQGSGDEGE